MRETNKKKNFTPISTPVTPFLNLPDGDFYSGQFSGNIPHGSGKYTWLDGCTYDGTWHAGKPSGKGTFTWPSGSTFIGNFCSGQIHGIGLFIGPAGDTYHGLWVSDQKHGYGQKCYPNGDSYDGWWTRGSHHGHIRYMWSNGNSYDGEWRRGFISGKGVLSWPNGNRYHGLLEHDFPKGNVILKCPDSSSYIGFWNKASKMNWRKRSSVDFPRICIWESDGSNITCDIVDNVEASTFYKDRTERNVCCDEGVCKKSGQIVSKGHKNYDLTMNLKLGIRHSVGRHASFMRDLRSSDFDLKEKFWTKFPMDGSKVTPPHQSGEFWWKDYCPVVFWHLRYHYRVDPADYVLAICGKDSLRELSSPGKSGSFFYLTQDDRLMIKTAKKSEVKVLIRMLHNYYQHVSKYENSLVTKFYGVHCVKPVGGQKTRFIVMGNLFFGEYQIHRRFDLKGSSHGRTTAKLEAEIDENTTLKDLDLNFIFRLQKNWFRDLIRQIDLDCEFLEAEGIMDYSLLVGLHFRANNLGEKVRVSPFLSGKQDMYENEKAIRGYRFLEAELLDMDRVLSG